MSRKKKKNLNIFCISDPQPLLIIQLNIWQIKCKIQYRENMIRKCLRLPGSFFATAFNSNKDYYKILNLKSTASSEQIKKSFRTLAKQYHPDANKGNEEKFKQLNEAYQVLSSQIMKKDYDDVRRSQQSSSYQHTDNRQSFNNRYSNTRQQQQYNTYRGYQEDFGWRNKDFRQQTINNMYRRQQQEFYNQTNSRYGPQHDQALKNRNKSYQNDSRQSSQNGQDMERKLDEMFRKNAEKIKITRQSVRRAYEQEQKRRQREYEEYKDKRNGNAAEDLKDKAFKMAQGVKENIDGIVKVGKYVKQNLDGAIKVFKFTKKLWDQFNKKK